MRASRTLSFAPALAAVALSFATSSAKAAPSPFRTHVTNAPRSSVSVDRPVHAIQGGTADTTDKYAVGVCLAFGGHFGPGNCGGVCTGVLIAPNLVVTARHCVDTTPDTIDCASSTFGMLTAPADQLYITTDASMSQMTTGWHQVSSVITPTANGICGNDLALLQLTDAIAATEAVPATPAVQFPVYNHKHYGTTETAIGYGESAPGMPTTSLTRRDRQTIPIQCVVSDPILAEDCVTQDKTWASVTRVGEMVAGAGTCEGDSGSGMFDQATYAATPSVPTVLGVLSRGSESMDGLTCELGIYTRLDTFRDLLVQTVTSAAATGGYPVPAWTAPMTDDGVYTNPDGGAASASDSGAAEVDASTVGSGTAAAGAACTTNSDCASNTCRENQGAGSFTCTVECDPSSTTSCPNGLTCEASGFCFAGAASEASSGSSGGCAVAPRSGPARPVPWKERIASVALAFGLVALTRHGRRKRGGSKR